MEKVLKPGLISQVLMDIMQKDINMELATINGQMGLNITEIGSTM
jgi:hypothetical protein